MKSREAAKVKWEEMFPEELLEAIRKTRTCFLAYGLAEPHGPYNAIGLDWLKAYALVCRGAEAHGAVVAPPCAWHITEEPRFHGPWFSGIGLKQPLASSIPADLFYRMVLYQIRAVDARDFHAAVFVTGHYGGNERTMRLLCEYYTRRTGSPLRMSALADWELIRFEDYRGDHAGVCETSQLMALRPELVDLSRTTVPRALGGRLLGTAFPDKKGRSPDAGVGESIVRSQVERMGEIKRKLLASYRPQAGWEAPSLRDVDDIWHRFERVTRKYWTATWREHKEKTGPKFPGWEELGE
jgi:creatinine amidohydrolase